MHTHLTAQFMYKYHDMISWLHFAAFIDTNQTTGYHCSSKWPINAILNWKKEAYITRYILDM